MPGQKTIYCKSVEMYTRDCGHAFRQYLSQERELSVSSQCIYTRFAHQFLRERFSRGSLELSALSATDVTGFIHATLTSAALVAPNTSSVHYEPSCDTCDTAARLRQTLPPVCPRWRTGHYRRYRSSFSQDKYSKCLITAIAQCREPAQLCDFCAAGAAQSAACEVVAMTLDDID